jgi:hypothetical protein
MTRGGARFQWRRFYLGDRFINMEMVRDGFTSLCVRIDKAGEFTAAESGAREHRRGLWADANPMPPCMGVEESQTGCGEGPDDVWNAQTHAMTTELQAVSHK